MSFTGVCRGYGQKQKQKQNLIASCVKNILTKNYQNLITDFQATVKNVGDASLRHRLESRRFYGMSI